MEAHYGISASVKNCNGATIQIFRSGCQGERHAETSSKQHRRLVVQFAGQDDTYSVSLFVLATRIQMCRGCLKHVSQ